MTDSIVIRGAILDFKTMRSDGAGRLTIDMSEVETANFLKLFPFPFKGTEVAVAALNNPPTATAQPLPPKETGSQDEPAISYGSYAKQLWMSVFMGTKEVWEACGSDESFLAFVRSQKCCARSGSPCEGPIQAAHVWRLAAGAGKGVKPPYSAVALCAKHHRLQHQHGEDAVGGRNYLEAQAFKTVKEWAWEAIKDDIGVVSMREADPKLVIAWANQKGIARFLPADYLEVN